MGFGGEGFHKSKEEMEERECFEDEGFVGILLKSAK